MIKFKAGRDYQMKFIGDSELIVPVRIKARTAKTAMISIRGTAEPKRVKIYTYEGSEYILPEGRYSMAPSCYAKNKIGIAPLAEPSLKVDIIEYTRIKQIIVKIEDQEKRLVDSMLMKYWGSEEEKAIDQHWKEQNDLLINVSIRIMEHLILKASNLGFDPSAMALLKDVETKRLRFIDKVLPIIKISDLYL